MGYMASMWLGFGGALAAVAAALADDPVGRVRFCTTTFAWATTATMSRYHRSADDVPEGDRADTASGSVLLIDRDGSPWVASAEPAECRFGLRSLEGSYGGKALVRRLPGNVGEVTTNTRKCGSDVVAVDGLQVMHCQLLRIVAAVEIDIYAQQELVEPGGSVAGPRPVHDCNGPIAPDKQVVGADVSVEEASAGQAG